MRTILVLLFFICTSVVSNAQSTPQETTMFGQCMIEISSATEMSALETEMRSNPYVKIVRLDYNSQRAFLLTKGIDQLTEEQFISWFNAYGDKVRCIQVGTYGVDTVKPFPFEGCDK